MALIMLTEGPDTGRTFGLLHYHTGFLAVVQTRSTTLTLCYLGSLTNKLVSNGEFQYGYEVRTTDGSSPEFGRSHVTRIPNRVSDKLLPYSVALSSNRVSRVGAYSEVDERPLTPSLLHSTTKIMPYGVSNSFKRGITRTYSRQPRRILADDVSNSDINYPRKRVRMDDSGNVVTTILPVESVEAAPSSTAPSSPAPYDSALISSDPVCDGSASPPSSPPPRLPSPAFKPSKTISTSLKRKRSTLSDRETQASGAFAETSGNKMGKTPVARKARHLTQMQIDLGGETRKACKGCGMDYIPSNKEDVNMHKEFHSMNVRGVDMGKAFLKEAKMLEIVDGGEVLSVVDGRSSLAMKNKARKVLEVVNKELGAVDIEDSMLWGSCAVPTTKRTLTRRANTLRNSGITEGKEDRFRFFLYMIGDKCVGFCLAERIHNASKVVTPELPPLFDQGQVTSTRSSSISVAATRDPALLGISRIWTSMSHRRKGIASLLLDCARGNFFYGIEVPKEMVAFSQPSESGGRLAEAWFANTAGWHVYAGGQ